MYYTLPINEAENQLRNVLLRLKTTHKPVVLTNNETATPVAVVLEMDAYEQTQRDKQKLYQLQLMQLATYLDQVEDRWDDLDLRQECISTWQESMDTVWATCPEECHELCASLILAVKQMSVELLTPEQVDALRFTIKVMRTVTPDQNDVDRANEQLIESRLYPILAFDNELVQSYIDES